MPHRFLKLFLDTFFPWKCISCKKEVHFSYPLCKKCQKNIPINYSFICPVCKKRIINFSKRSCFCKTYINALGVVSFYENSIIRKTIHFFKYQPILSLQKPLAGLMIKFLKETNFFSEIDKKNILLIPIPLHKRKRRQRGFNQSELLAKAVASHFSLNFHPKILFRIKNNPPQAKINNFSDRKENSKNIFQISSPNLNLIKGKWIILIDDVYTSGATMQEAAKILKKNGAKKIIGLVLARG
jgi:ComF family protein